MSARSEEVQDLLRVRVHISAECKRRLYQRSIRFRSCRSEVFFLTSALVAVLSSGTIGNRVKSSSSNCALRGIGQRRPCSQLARLPNETRKKWLCKTLTASRCERLLRRRQAISLRTISGNCCDRIEGGGPRRRRRGVLFLIVVPVASFR